MRVFPLMLRNDKSFAICDASTLISFAICVLDTYSTLRRCCIVRYDKYHGRRLIVGSGNIIFAMFLWSIIINHSTVFCRQKLLASAKLHIILENKTIKTQFSCTTPRTFPHTHTSPYGHIRDIFAAQQRKKTALCLLRTKNLVTSHIIAQVQTKWPISYKLY